MPHRRLGRAIDRGRGKDLVSGDRADDDDTAVLLLTASPRLEPPRALGNRQEDAADIGGEQAVDLVDAEAERNLFGRDTGVGDDRVDGTARGLGGVIGGLETGGT